jgi:carboxyl-terminal processing protease
MKPLGAVKLTTQKFYRINGGATQLKGVTPDIIIPDAWAYVDRGEREQDYVMPWDEIAPCKYNVWKIDPNTYTKVRRDSRERMAKDPAFKLVEDNAQSMKVQRDEKFATLNLDAYRAEQKRLKEQSDAFKAAFTTIKGTTVVNLASDLETINADTVRVKMNKEWVDGLTKDIYIHEACAVLKDLR